MDDGGNLMYLERIQPTFPMGATISTEKARTAALFQKPTKILEDAIVGGRLWVARRIDFAYRVSFSSELLHHGPHPAAGAAVLRREFEQHRFADGLLAGERREESECKSSQPDHCFPPWMLRSGRRSASSTANVVGRPLATREAWASREEALDLANFTINPRGSRLTELTRCSTRWGSVPFNMT